MTRPSDAVLYCSRELRDRVRIAGAICDVTMRQFVADALEQAIENAEMQARLEKALGRLTTRGET